MFLSGQVFMDMIFTGLPGLPPPGTEIVTDGLGSAPGGVANIAVAMSGSACGSGSRRRSATTCSVPTCGARSPSRRASTSGCRAGCGAGRRRSRCRWPTTPTAAW
ncbi:hypothetical protein [Actinomadura madurae]|uniref:hypothetical protein n=1 Tax=Actinomadura madurae TaxID=1993 RepID=UPI0020D25F66|nr:hypothetical protein [Actinomadura madurae]MCQ0012936.1 hypothetical protein [Actinomadura madurae]